MRKIGYLVAVASACLALPAAAQNLVSNGDFELGNNGSFTSGYQYVATPGPTAMYGEGTYTVGTNAANYHNLWASVAAYSGANYLIANGAPGDNLNVWSQTITGLTIGQVYQFSAYITNVCCNSSFGGTNGTPVIVAANGTLFRTTGSTTGTGNWTRISGAFTANSATANLSIFNDNSVASGNDFGLDAISLTAVPEPATWAMMIGGFGLVGGVMRRRKVKTSVAFA